MSTAPNLSVVVPVYKEERTVQPFLRRLEPVLDRLNVSYEILFCLDPSPDRTEAIIAAEIQRNARIRLMVFSRRFGQPAATIAGILASRGDACVVIDVDLQDPPEVIAPLYAKLNEGYEVVYAQRRSRKGEPLIKRLFAYLAYVVIGRMSTVEIPRNTGDFRIMTRRVVEELRRLNERHGFLRGLVAYVGFRQTFVEYERDPRAGGTGKYNRLTGSLKIFMNGLIGFSMRPLQMMWVIGAALAALSVILALAAEVSAIVLAVMFFSGLQLVCLGLMGEYVGRIYDEVRQRPMFIVDRRVNFDD